MLDDENDVKSVLLAIVGWISSQTTDDYEAGLKGAA